MSEPERIPQGMPELTLSMNKASCGVPTRCDLTFESVSLSSRGHSGFSINRVCIRMNRIYMSNPHKVVDDAKRKTVTPSITQVDDDFFLPLDLLKHQCHIENHW